MMNFCKLRIITIFMFQEISMIKEIHLSIMVFFTLSSMFSMNFSMSRGLIRAIKRGLFTLHIIEIGCQSLYSPFLGMVVQELHDIHLYVWGVAGSETSAYPP